MKISTAVMLELGEGIDAEISKVQNEVMQKLNEGPIDPQYAVQKWIEIKALKSVVKRLAKETRVQQQRQ